MKILIVINEKYVETEIVRPSSVGNGEIFRGKRVDMVIVDDGIKLLGESLARAEHMLSGKNYHRDAELL